MNRPIPYVVLLSLSVVPALLLAGALVVPAVPPAVPPAVAPAAAQASSADGRPEDAGGKEKKPTSDEPVPDAERRSALERKFQETLSGAVLVGKWRLVRGDKLGEEKGDRYSLGKVTRVRGDTWTIEARIQFGEKDVAIPVPVKVLWAGDTPVITVDKLWLPGLGTYTARVVVHNGLYAGTWFGTGYGGLMSGTIVREKRGDEEAEKEKEGD